MKPEDMRAAMGEDWFSLAKLHEKIATLLAELAQARAEVGRLEGVIEKTLAYKGPKWPDEMTKMEKLAHLYKGDINWRPE